MDYVLLASSNDETTFFEVVLKFIGMLSEIFEDVAASLESVVSIFFTSIDVMDLFSSILPFVLTLAMSLVISVAVVRTIFSLG